MTEFHEGCAHKECEGKKLYPPYYIYYPYINLISDACMNSEDESIQTAKITELIRLKMKDPVFVDAMIRQKKRLCGKHFREWFGVVERTNELNGELDRLKSDDLANHTSVK